MSGYVVKRTESLREQMVEAILHDLRMGSISPGERLTEEGLAKRFNVSRTPVREALNQLTHQGLLEARTGGGYIVPFPTPDEIRKIIFVRKLLEPAAIRLAADEFGRGEIERMSGAIAGEVAHIGTRSAADFAKANEEFRDAIFQRISNKILSNAIAQFNNHLGLIRSSTLSDLELRKEIVNRQEQIRDAIKSHDADKAESLWMHYLDLTEKTLIAAIINWSPDRVESQASD
ncbi:GntR family transcriptional regulator [Phyllobacterium sp. YR531]|uniref:GntR family transcriptional regulator n=1 Tax=Phyllobacterium sp. YR531 TaxID=1144343 RepID=UPI00026FBA84|nr:GntR family transcriptional regulator [Phyllobacterium sp. YR531]EJN05854.1 transcriptional regulator [Phyllobacterium sp. YR531]